MATNRFFSTDNKSRKDLISSGIKCVFLAHQKDDKPQVVVIANYLQKAGIDIYFDEHDTELRIHHQNNNPKKVTEAILKGINNSTHMLVIVSPNTVNSSWVPFEIGYGFEKTNLLVLCLKGFPAGSLPEYIRTAPIIRDIYDINNLISNLTTKTKELLVEARLMSDYNSSANPLHNIMDKIINAS